MNGVRKFSIVLFFIMCTHSSPKYISLTNFHFVLFADSENFAPKPPASAALNANKWEGEDEDVSVKVSFHDFKPL